MISLIEGNYSRWFLFMGQVDWVQDVHLFNVYLKFKFNWASSALFPKLDYPRIVKGKEMNIIPPDLSY